MRRALLTFCCALALAPGAHAQSLFGTRGLGVPVAPVDARARVLGGIGVGLIGLNTSLVNPAEVAGVQRRGVMAALQPVSSEFELLGQTASVSGTRFPLIGVILPVSRFVLTIGYGAAFDQSWGVETHDTVVLNGVDVPVRDIVESTGGISQARIGVATMVTSNFALGASVGLYTGVLDRNVTRVFEDESGTYAPFTTGLRWDYTGPTATIGARWDPDAALRLGAAVTVNGDLEANGKQGGALDRSFKLPVRVDLGASGMLASDLLAAVNAQYARVEDGEASGPGFGAVGQSTWRYGGGLEWLGLGNARRTYPIRLGAQVSDLPYFTPGEEPAREVTFGGGVGFRLAADASGPLAVADMALERGERSGLASEINGADGLNESFWRFTFSLALFGR